MHLPRQTIATISSWKKGISRMGSGGWIAGLVRSGILLTYFFNPLGCRNG
jgi:hypothetical protein